MVKTFKKPLIEWVLDHLFHDDVDTFILWYRMESGGGSITTSFSKTAFEKYLRAYRRYKKAQEYSL